MITDEQGKRAAATVNRDARAMPVVNMAQVARRRQVTSVLSGTLLVVLILGGGTLVASALNGGTGLDTATPIGETAICPPDSTPDLPGPQDQARPEPSDWAIGAVDAESGVLVALQWGGHLRENQIETWTFDLCTNTWRVMSPETGPPAWSAYDMAYDAQSDLIVAIAAGDASAGVWAYDTNTDTWTPGAEVPLTRSKSVAVYDPAADLIVSIDPRQTWLYDVDTDAWEQRSNPPDLGYSPSIHATYDSTLGQIVAWTHGFTATYDGYTATYDIVTDTWERLTLATPDISMGYGVWGGLMAHDTASGLTVILTPDAIATFNGRIPVWEYESPQSADSPGDTIGPLDRWEHAIVADPVNDRIVVFGGSRFATFEGGPEGEAQDIWAFEPATRKWTLLLADIPG